MATRAPFARLAHYSHEFSEACHIFFKNVLLRMSASLASTCQTAWQMLAQACMIIQVVLSTNNIFITVQLTLTKFAKVAKMHQTPLTKLPNFVILAKLDQGESQLQGNIRCFAKLQKFWRVLAFAKFACKLPLLSYYF